MLNKCFLSSPKTSEHLQHVTSPPSSFWKQALRKGQKSVNSMHQWWASLVSLPKIIYYKHTQLNQGTNRLAHSHLSESIAMFAGFCQFLQYYYVSSNWALLKHHIYQWTQEADQAFTQLKHLFSLSLLTQSPCFSSLLNLTCQTPEWQLSIHNAPQKTKHCIHVPFSLIDCPQQRTGSKKFLQLFWHCRDGGTVWRWQNKLLSFE